MGSGRTKMSVTTKRQRPIDGMCDDCARRKKTHCDVLLEPAYIHEQHEGKCWAKVDATRAKEIEEEIAFRGRVPRGRR
jgi:hypothetical protein